MDYIELKGIEFHAYHGVGAQEKIIGNLYTIDVKLFYTLDKVLESDNLNDTINYAEVYETIKKEMAVSSNLIEYVAGRIIKSLKEQFPRIEEIEIRLAKRNPPMGAKIKEAAVCIRK